MSNWDVKECPNCSGLDENCNTCNGTGQIEEINTSYDQNQPIGDTPSDYPALGGEPIDARTGDDFMTVKRLQEDDIEPKTFKNVWQQLDTSVKKIEEKLNKDGTGISRATRGIDPTKTPAQVLQFVYVSKSECDICKQYDGMHFPIDSPNRPVIPRLESQESGGSRPYTHPNCKCKWVRPFSKSGMKNFGKTRGGEAKTLQQHHDLIEQETKKKYPNYDKMSEQQKRMLFIKTGLDKLTDGEVDYDHAIEMFDTIQPKIKGQESSPYGIQKMLDMFVDKKLTKEEKLGVEEEHNLDFTLENLLRLVAEKIAEKASKKMGLESKANEGGVGSGKKGHQKWMRGTYVESECENCMIRTEKKDGKCAICGL
jgi:hypothetical protein